MHDAGAACTAPFGSQNLNRFSFSFPSMNDHRKIALSRRSKLPAEDFDLDVTRRVVVVEIETNLTPRNNTPVFINQLSYALFGAVVVKPRVVRMDTDRRKNVGSDFGQL